MRTAGTGKGEAGSARVWKLLAALLAAALVACGREVPVDRATLTQAVVPAEHVQGEALFERHCAGCHGAKALGAALGPPLVDLIYQPRHHGDAAFQLAVMRGVAAHHSRFGNMPPVPGVSSAQVDSIAGYVRWLQRLAGIE